MAIVWKETQKEKRECEFEWEGYHADFVEPVFSIVTNHRNGPFCLWYIPLTENYRVSWEEGLIGDRCMTLEIAKREAEEFYADRENKIREIEKYYEKRQKQEEEDDDRAALNAHIKSRSLPIVYKMGNVYRDVDIEYLHWIRNPTSEERWTMKELLNALCIDFLEFDQHIVLKFDAPLKTGATN